MPRKKRAYLLGAGARRRREITNRTIREERRQDRPEGVHLQRDAVRARRVRQSRGEAGAERGQRPVEFRRQILQTPQARRHRQRVPRQRARLSRRDRPATPAPSDPPARRRRPPAALRPMILPRQVRSGRTPASACAPPAAARNPEITLVEDQQRAGAAGDSRAGRTETRRPRHHADVASDRLHDHRRDLIAVRVEEAPDRLEIVVRRHQGVGRRAARDAGAGRRAERQRARSGLTRNASAWP